MVSFRELKELIIENEVELDRVRAINNLRTFTRSSASMVDVHGEDASMYIDGIIDEINMCEDIYDIISFYDQHGIDTREAFYIVTELLMHNTNLNK
jgi:hypothetical protein